MSTPVKTRAQVGIDAPSVLVEAHHQPGTSSFTLVGMAQKAVREARDRVRSAIRNVGLKYPQGRVVVNLAPADMAKHGGRYDLAIAVAILAATDQVDRRHLDKLEFLGELSLYGEVRAITGAFCAAAKLAGSTTALIAPASHRDELGAIGSVGVYPVASLLDVVRAAADRGVACAGTVAAAATLGAHRSLAERRARPDARQKGVDGRRRRRSPHADDGAAGYRQNHACPPSRGSHAAADRCRSHRSGQCLLRLEPSGARLRGAAVLRSPPHGLHGGHCRGRQSVGARRSHVGALRCPVPRRIAGIPARRARSPARAPRG